MLSVIKNKFVSPKTENTTNLYRRICRIDLSVIEPLLTSQHLGEGVYAFELLDDEIYFTSPSYFREEIGVESHVDLYYLQNDLTNLHCYQIGLSKPSFLPLFTETYFPLLQHLQSLNNSKYLVFTQFLFSQCKDRWKEEMIDQYEQYLKGNDFPSTSKIGRKFQERSLKILNKVGGFNTERQHIPEIEQKILDNGYRFEFRLIVHSEEKMSDFEQNLKEIMQEMSFFNELLAIKMKNRKEFVGNFVEKRLTNISKHQIISEKELISIVSYEEIEQKHKPDNILVESEKIREGVMNDIGSLISLLPIGKIKERRFDDSIGKKLLHSIKRVGIKNNAKFKIMDLKQGATLQKITLKLPDGVNYTDIKKKAEDIQNAFGVESFSIEHGEEAETISVLVPCDERDIVHLKQLMTAQEFIDFSKDAYLPFILGVDPIGNLMFADLVAIVHILVTGQTGGGKSKFLNQLILTMLILRNPSELMMYLIDPKKVEFKQFNGFPQVQKVITDMSEAAKIFASLEVEMNKRYEVMSKSGHKKIGEYNKSSKEKLPFIVVVVDEYADLKKDYPKIEKYIETFGGKARAAGIHMIIATQYPLADIVSSVIKENLPSQISFRLKSNVSYKTVFGTGIPYTLLGMGDGVARIEGSAKEFQRFQSPTITIDDNEEIEVCKKIGEMMKGEKEGGIELIKEEEKIDQLKRIIIETGETRIKELQNMMGIRINVVNELVKCLVSEGWLIKEEGKKGYEFIASEEEIKKWEGSI
jgi:DNA segregation ATPase FtsK/SpoIIIE, S-DNA-T family